MDNEIGTARYQNDFAMMQRTKLFTAKEVSAIYLATSYVQKPKDGEKAQVIHIPKEDLEAYGVSTAKVDHKDWSAEMSKIALNLTGFSVLNPSDDPRKVGAKAVFYEVEVDRDNGMTIELNNDFAPKFLWLKEGGFTRMHLLEISELKSQYSRALYPMIKTFVFRSKDVGWSGELIEIDHLRKLLGIPDKKYKLFANFRDRILDRAIAEINDKTKLKITYEPKKKSGARGYTHVLIYAEEDSKKYIESDIIPYSEVDPVIMEYLDNLKIVHKHKILVHYDPDSPDDLYQAIKLFDDKSKKWPEEIKSGYLVSHIKELIDLSRKKRKEENQRLCAAKNKTEIAAQKEQAKRKAFEQWMKENKTTLEVWKYEIRKDFDGLPMDDKLLLKLIYNDKWEYTEQLDLGFD